ncbi:Solitary outer membrane autotransporter beta-barrel domain [Psychromonas hadalis]|uniref:Solitary outer membrane autotransporter beta-barrel domain n=1 Tax=Psychromonas hadalis TaxID=211669 RepID=UPI0003B4887E|nr:Solitary outer membrane autotransporter beta-barrel domain [Psychromonas hadalis]
MKQFLIALLLSFSGIVHAIENIGVKTLEQVLAISTVMTDSNALTFGIANFELKYLVDSDNPNWGDDKTLDFKKSIDILVLPYQWKLSDIDKNWQHSLEVRASYIGVQRNTEPLQGFTNFKEEQIFGAFLQYSQHYQLSKNWYSGVALGAHLTYYSNKYNYSAGFPPELKNILDGHIFNTSATVLMAEPVFNVGYQKTQSWGQWTLHNSNHYLIGQGIGGAAKSISDVNPEGWRVTNGIEFKFAVPNLWGVSDHIALDMKRIDVGGDMSGLSDNDYYFETSIGWVIDTKNKIPFLDNIGIGFNINYGSSISGGTVVLYYNE